MLVKLNKACGGDKPVREIAGTAKTFLNGVEKVYQEYQREAAKYPGQLPVISLASTTPVTSGNGAQKSTNYAPTFRIEGWAKRPEDLKYVPAGDQRQWTMQTQGAPTQPATRRFHRRTSCSAGPTGQCPTGQYKS